MTFIPTKVEASWQVRAMFYPRDMTVAAMAAAAAANNVDARNERKTDILKMSTGVNSTFLRQSLPTAARARDVPHHILR